MIKRILFADDQMENRLFVELCLADINCELTLAVDGEDGLNKFKELHHDLVITDLYMPKLNGIQLMTEVKKINKTVPVIGFTGAEFDDSDEDLTQMGFDELLHKPMDDLKFISIIMGYLA